MIEEKKKKCIKNSFSLPETKQDSSNHTLQENNQQKYIKEPIFNQLFFQTFEKGIPLPGKHPISSAFVNKPSFIRYFVVYANSHNQHSNLNENPPEICFWQNSEININENPSHLTALIQSQFSSLINKEDFIYDLSNKPKSIVTQEVKNLQGNKMVFHYIGNDTEQNFENGFNVINSESEPLPLRELLENSGNSQTYVFDCDNSGYLLHIINDFIKEKSKNSKTNLFDGFFFLSCSEGESMPRSTDYPVDLFTSCLTSPARVALLWHSRHYFCFQSGCLQPLPTFFVEDMNDKRKEIDKLLRELRSVLRCTVESMAYENMESDLFVKLFRTNHTLSELCVNFFLACRILSFFNVHPVSYPELPDLTECSQWQTFDLRLDAALCQIQSTENDDFDCKSLSYHNFLSQTLLSMKTFIESTSAKKIITVPFELSFFPEILNDSNLSSDACDVIAKYFDMAPDAVYCSLYYSIPQSLFRLLHESIINNRVYLYSSSPNRKIKLCSSLIFSIIKIICVYRDSIKNLIEDKWDRCIIDDLLPYMQVKNENSNLLSILLALLMRDLTFKDHKNLCKIMIDQYDDDTKRWLIMMFSYGISSITDYKKIREILNQIVELSKTANTDLQIAIMSSLLGFVRSKISKNMNSDSMILREENENIVIETALQFSKSESYLLRRELLIFLKNFKEIHQEEFNKPFEEQESNFKKISSFFIQCENDPDDLVRQELLNKESRSIVFDTYIASLYFPVLPLISNFKQISLPEILRSESNKDDRQFQMQVNQHRNLKPKIERFSKYTMKVSSFYKHSFKIFSNLISIPTEKIVFGDVNGNVCIKSWNSSMIHTTIKVTNESITDVRYTQNSGKPLLFSATENGNCFVTSITEKVQSKSDKFKHSYFISNIERYSNTNPQSIYQRGTREASNEIGSSNENEMKTEYQTSYRSSFQLFPDVEFPCHIHQAIDEWNMRLYSYASHKSHEFKIRDLRSDRFLPSIKPKKGSTKSLVLNPKDDKTVALCGRGFEIYDLRASIVEPQIYIIDQLIYPPFMVNLVDDSIPIFAILSKKSSITKVDARYPTGARSFELICNMEFQHVTPSSFATFPSKIQFGKELTYVAALSNEFGISFFDVDNFAQEIMPQNSKLGMKIANSSALVFHSQRYELAGVNNSNYILNMNQDSKEIARYRKF